MTHPKTKDASLKEHDKIPEGEPDQTTAAAEFWTEGRVRLLVISIVAMAIILVVGFGFIIYTVIERSLTAKEQQSIEIKTLRAPAPGLEIDLNGYKILSVAGDGSLLTMHVEKEGKAEIWLVNTTTKKIRKVIKLKP